jgi:hypothetical protein
MAFQECEEVAAPESSLAPASYSKTRQLSGVGPSPERCLAHVQEGGCVSDVKQLVRVRYLVRPQGFTQLALRKAGGNLSPHTPKPLNLCLQDQPSC